MASKSQHSVRESIQHLLAILVDCGVPKLSSETFRQAKFNKSEATELFWGLLLHLVQLVQFLDSGGFGNIHNITFHKPKPLKTVAMVTRRHVFSLGYSRAEFYTTPFESVGSRELLLALSWLFHRSELVAHLTQYHLREANNVHIPLKPSRQFLIQLAAEESEHFCSELSQILSNLATEASPTAGSLQQAMEQLAWLKGRLDCKWRAALNSRLSYQRMADKLHKCTASSSIVTSKPAHLTLHELFLLRHPELLSSYLKKLEYHTLCLQRLAQWREYEGLYWQWMDSVVDLSEREGEDEEKQCSNTELTSKVQRLASEVEELLERNNPKIERLKHIWHLKSRTVTDREIQSAGESFGRDLEGLFLERRGCSRRTTDSAKQKVESLERLDHALCLPAGKDDEARPSKKTLQGFPSLGEEEREVRTRLLQISRGACSQVRDELARMENGIQELKLNISRQLNTLEHRLPDTVCKIEPCNTMI